MSNKETATQILSNGELWLLLRSTWSAISRLLDLELDQFGLTLEQVTVLRVLKDNGGTATFKDLSDITLRQQQSISILVNRMIKAGLLARKKHPTDTLYKISITKKGEELLDRATMIAVDLTFSSLTAQEKQDLIAGLSPLHQKARDLLVVSNIPPFLQILRNKNIEPSPAKKEDARVSDNRLWTLLDQTCFAISRLRELELAPLGVTTVQSFVFKMLHDHQGCITARELEVLMIRQHHSVSTLINRMMKMGLVRKEKSAKGKRRLILFTEEGETLFNRMTVYAIDMSFADLTDSQKQQLYHCLSILNTRAISLLGISNKPLFLQYSK